MSSRSIAMEMVRALCVLAVVFLNFAHQAPVLAKSPPTELLAVASSLSFCGDGEALPDSKGHAPCHACRLGAAADLPVVPVPGAPRLGCTEQPLGLIPLQIRIDPPQDDHPARAPPALA